MTLLCRMIALVSRYVHVCRRQPIIERVDGNAILWRLRPSACNLQMSGVVLPIPDLFHPTG